MRAHVGPPLSWARVHPRAIWTPTDRLSGAQGPLHWPPTRKAPCSASGRGAAVRAAAPEGHLRWGPKAHIWHSQSHVPSPGPSPFSGSISNPLLTFKHTHEMLRVSIFYRCGFYLSKWTALANFRVFMLSSSEGRVVVRVRQEKRAGAPPVCACFRFPWRATEPAACELPQLRVVLTQPAWGAPAEARRSCLKRFRASLTFMIHCSQVKGTQRGSWILWN